MKHDRCSLTLAAAANALAAASLALVAAGCAARPASPETHTRYVIERELPGAGELSHEELRAIARRSNLVLAQLGAEIRWVESYVTADKIYCVYLAKDPALIHQHAARGGFPADRVSAVAAVIGPETGR